MDLQSGEKRFVLPLHIFISIHVVLGLSLGDADQYRRKVSLELNPGLNSTSSAPLNVSILHVKAVGNNDTLHIILASLGPPSLLLVHTGSSDTQLKIDWNRLMTENSSRSVWVEPVSSVLYSRALLFTKVWEYNDVNDTADFPSDPSKYMFPPYNLEEFVWDDLNKSLDKTAHTAKLCGKNVTDQYFVNGSICFKISAFDALGRDEKWPCFLHNANSSQIQFEIDRVLPRSNKSRFGLELVSIEENGVRSWIDTKHSIDDEYTPSIFQVYNLLSVKGNGSGPVLGYTHWKPVAYRNKTPVFEQATPSHHTGPQSKLFSNHWGLPIAFFGKDVEPKYTIMSVNITFGIAGEPYYNETYYLSWTSLVGIGSPPEDPFSTLVICIIAVGLGAPMVILLMGCIIVQLKRRKPVTPPGYQPIN